MKRRVLKIFFYVVAIVIFGNVTIEYFEYKLMDAKFSYNDIVLLEGSIIGLADNKYELNIMVENNSSEEFVMYDYYVNLFSDNKLKDEIYFDCESYEEIVIPGGSTGNAILNITFEKNIKFDEVYAEIDHIEQNDNSIKLKIIRA